MTMNAKQSYFHRGGETSLLGQTISQRFAEVVSRYPEQPAVVSLPQNQRITYRQFSEKIDAVAKGLLAFEFKPGDRIGIWSTNNIEWLIVQMATARIGVILVNINPANRAPELAYALKRSEVQGLFLIPAFRSSDYIEILAEQAPELKSHSPALKSATFAQLNRVIVYDPQNSLETKRPYKGFTLWQELIEAGTRIANADLEAVTKSLDFDDPINIQYTSGTTGSPKPVVLSHHNILNNAYFTAQEMSFNSSDSLCVPVPFYHCFGMVLANLVCFSVGAKLVIPSEHFDPLLTLQAIEKEKCSALHGVPTMFIAQLEHPNFGNFQLDSLRTGIMAGAPCPAELMKRVIDEMHCENILIGYGQTEASPLTHLTTAHDSFERRIHTVGKNLPHQEVKIISTETGKIQPIGEIGEICFRGHHVMLEYYKDKEATDSTLDQKGWLRSGDLGTMDKDGYVRITGRLKEMVIRGGENIYPAEIEEVIFNHPEVEQVAVFGIPDAYFGEELVAWVRLKQGGQLNELTLREYCLDHLAHFKTPKTIQFVDSFPMTVTGKLQKFKMRELAISQNYK